MLRSAPGKRLLCHRLNASLPLLWLSARIVSRVMCKERSQRQTRKFDPLLVLWKEGKESKIVRAARGWISMGACKATIHTFYLTYAKELLWCRSSQGMEAVKSYSGSSLMSVMMNSMESPPSQAGCCKLQTGSSDH